MHSAGFIELQCNGYKGLDFSADTLTKSDFCNACDQLFANGTAAFLPTICTSSMEAYEHTLPLISTPMEDQAYQGRLLGLHLEGPFMSNTPGAVGAHNPEWMQNPDPSQLDRLIELSNNHIRLLTIAADLPEADILCRYAVSKGITVSLGHQLSTDKSLATLAAAGATLLTHLGNGLPNELHRHHNPIYAGLANDDLKAMIITDGHHLPPSLIKIMLRAKSLENIIITSDAGSLAGMPPGAYGDSCMLEENGLLHDPHKGCMVGSSYTLFECMNYLASLGILSESELWRVGFSNPLAAIGLNESDIDMTPKINFDIQTRCYSLIDAPV